MKTPIGIFDSGFGGLEILREIVDLLPEYDYIYLGDSARSPYGDLEQEKIYSYTEQAVDFLFKQGCGLIVVACNTVSSEALRKIQQEFLVKKYPDKRVLGVVIPASEIAVNLTKNKKIGVMATQGTVDSGSFIRELKKLDEDIEIYQQACPLLVPLIEKGEDVELGQYLDVLIEKGVDTLILGCTHYGLLIDKIKEITGPEIEIVSEGRIVAEKLQDYLARHSEIEEKISKDSTIEFLTTDLTEKFRKIGSVFFGKEIEVKKVDIQE